MALLRSALILLMSATLVLGQRPSFAGTRPIGYPEIETPNKNEDGLGDRFGEVDGTTPKLPIEANGDLGLIDRLSKLPIDKQPFWFINWQAYEEHRKNPQTYPQRPNQFLDPIVPSNANSGVPNSNSGTFNSNFGSSNSNSASSTTSDSTANRFGEPDSDSKVKPVVLSSSNKKPGSRPNHESKPVENKTPSTNKDNSKLGSSVPNSDSTKPNSEAGSKVEEAAPVVPSPIEPEASAIDGLKLKADSNDNQKFSYFKRP